ncbi:MAG: hypothetical protein ACRDKI_06850 [Solirubrobacterales bacterium]
MSRAALGSLLAVVVFALAAGSAGAVATVGAVPGSTTTGPGCVGTGCDFYEISSSGNGYVVPADGVLTAFTFRSGTTLTLTDFIHLQAYRPGSGTVTLIGETPDYQFNNQAADGLPLLPARLPVKAGDLVGIRGQITGNTAFTFASGGDVSGRINIDPAVGETVLTGLHVLATANEKVNVVARLESDADGDGYGDESQDLCPSNPAHGGSGCSGSLVGSGFVNPMAGTLGCSTCVLWNNSGSGVVGRVPAGGVIVRWRMLTGEPFFAWSNSYQLRVVRPLANGDIRLSGTSAPLQRSPGTTPMIGADTRIPVAAGDAIGLQSANDQNLPFSNVAGGGVADEVQTKGPDGTTATPLGTTTNEDVLVNADVEPDADADGYGDETQDACPADAAVQTACPTPKLESLKFSPTRFKVDPKGAVVSKHAAGSSIAVKVDIPALVGFTVQQALPGRRSGRACRRPSHKNRKGRACLRYADYAKFSGGMLNGSVKVKFSGRVKRHGKTKPLPPGKYRLVAVATSVAGRKSAPRNASFSIVAR